MTHLHVVEVATKASKAADRGTTDRRHRSTGHRTARRSRSTTAINDNPSNSGSADISVVSVADKAVRKLVSQDGPDTGPRWSPDGTRIAFETTMANPWFFYANGLIAAVPASGGSNIDVLSKRSMRTPFFWMGSGRHLLLRRRAHVLAPVIASTPRPRRSKLTKDARGIGRIHVHVGFRRTAFLDELG